MLDSTGILVSVVAGVVLAWGVLVPIQTPYPLAYATALALVVFLAGFVDGRYR